MRCFRKQKDSDVTLISLEDFENENIDEGIDSQEDTHTQSSAKEPTPSSKVVERPLQKPTIVVSGCEEKESKGVQTQRDQIKQCQFCEESEGLPPSLIAAMQSSQCTHHNDRSLDLYCPSHNLPVCPGCAITKHLRCPSIQLIENVCQDKSGQLLEFVHVLEDHQKSVAELRRKVEAKLKSKDSWPGEVSAEKVESSTKKAYWQGGDHREAIKCPDHSPQPHATHGSCEICRLLPSYFQGPPQRIMIMLPFQVPVNTPSPEEPSTSQEVSGDNSSSVCITLTASPGFWLEEIQLFPQFAPNQSPQPKVKEFDVTDQSSGRTQPSPARSPTTTRQRYEPHDARPHGSALAKVLQVGHRVKRTADDEGRNLGTVVAIPSAGISNRSVDTTGLVNVRWDSGGEGSYRMGRHNHYELDLA